MYIEKYWGNFIGGSDDSLNLVAFLADQILCGRVRSKRPGRLCAGAHQGG